MFKAEIYHTSAGVKVGSFILICFIPPGLRVLRVNISNGMHRNIQMWNYMFSYVQLYLKMQ